MIVVMTIKVRAENLVNPGAEVVAETVDWLNQPPAVLISRQVGIRCALGDYDEAIGELVVSPSSGFVQIDETAEHEVSATLVVRLVNRGAVGRFVKPPELCWPSW